jgi:hypothetical protein
MRRRHTSNTRPLRRSYEIHSVLPPTLRNPFLSSTISSFVFTFCPVSTMVTKWTPFCPMSGSAHNSNFIECPDCGAVNPRMSEAAPVPVPQARPSQQREVLHISDSPPKAITVSRFASYGASRRGGGQQSRRPQGLIKRPSIFIPGTMKWPPPIRIVNN